MQTPKRLSKKRVFEAAEHFVLNEGEFTIDDVAKRLNYGGDMAILKKHYKEYLRGLKEGIDNKIGKINKDLIFAIANEMHANGLVPTSEEILKKLGHGGLSTITKYLKLWKAETGNSISTLIFHKEEDVFPVLDKMKRDGEFIGTKSLGRKLNSKNMRKMKSLVEAWKLSKITSKTHKLDGLLEKVTDSNKHNSFL